MSNKTIEQQAFDVLNETSYTLIIGGKEISFKQATLSQLEKISAIASKLPVFDEVDKTNDTDADIPQIVDSFKYARDLGNIIMVTADTTFNLKHPFKSLLNYIKARKVIYNRANAIQIWATVQQILKNNHVFFYQNTIISLKGMNQLKPTKETDQTVRGH